MENMFNLPVDFKVKALPSENDDFITIEGYANNTTVDRVGDIILEEAWTKGGMANYIKNPVILAYHDHANPIGVMTGYSVNQEGLKITANILKETGVYALINKGVLKTFSVGFRTKDADYDTVTDVFIIKDLELLEVSVVSIPANADSTFSVRKSFKTDKDYDLFKSEFVKDTSTVNTENVSDDNSDNKEEKDMGDTIDKTKIEAELRTQIAKEMKDEADRKTALEAEVSAQVEKATAANVTVVGERVEVLKVELEKRFEDDKVSMQATLDALKGEIKEYSQDLQNLNKSKMSFISKSGNESDVKAKDVDTAILISKILARPIMDTKYGSDLVTKAATTSDGAHQTAMTAEWEVGFSNRLMADVSEKLIVENLFTGLAMPRATMNIPLNPEAGYGTWVTTAQLAAATSSGTSQVHGLEDNLITAHKLATKELLSYEEEDDSLIPLVPIIRDAAVRRMARSSDKALLLGDAGVAINGTEGSYPFNGLATIAIDDSRTVIVPGADFANRTPVTIAELRDMRRLMGVHGHSPSDVVYLVSHDVYFDLLDDPTFLTMDKVGEKATALTGQVGMVSGSAVVVSGEFPSAAIDAVGAVCVNLSNYIKGDYKGITVERERSVEYQTNLLVVTRRFGMIELFPANATTVALVYQAA